MFPVTITISNIADLQKVQSVLYPTTAVVEVKDTSRDVKSAKNANPAATQAATESTVKTAAASASPSEVGKPAAATAPTSPTAAVVAAAAPETQAPVTYADVAKVATVLASRNRPAAEAVAAELGVPNFKALNSLPVDEQPAAFAKALELVNAALASLEVV